MLSLLNIPTKNQIDSNNLRAYIVIYRWNLRKSTTLWRRGGSTPPGGTVRMIALLVGKGTISVRPRVYLYFKPARQGRSIPCTWGDSPVLVTKSDLHLLATGISLSL